MPAVSQVSKVFFPAHCIEITRASQYHFSFLQGKSYRGTVAKTWKGVACIPWADSCTYNSKQYPEAGTSLRFLEAQLKSDALLMFITSASLQSIIEVMYMFGHL
jgi:hypothetical protein